ncbi:uncharacterized protein PSFLO_05667 [Pseudozyma flocculosa]|uniref:Uncharacterized protein n=1 Tax=Pseudozyma flocculosa TaxID=84751 RepID=A0A5C3F978_9BASI|nr:uncharacterized protein PSFLO_05667 [Pseudozyma flocculosa]
MQPLWPSTRTRSEWHQDTGIGRQDERRVTRQQPTVDRWWQHRESKAARGRSQVGAIAYALGPVWCKRDPTQAELRPVSRFLTAVQARARKRGAQATRPVVVLRSRCCHGGRLCNTPRLLYLHVSDGSGPREYLDGSQVVASRPLARPLAASAQ